MGDRVILHCDCNSFFASVETALNPKYKGVPMAVCGSVDDRHGIVLAKNELAKKYGIETAETVYSAKRKCKDLVIASPHYDEYGKYSKRVNDIYKEYTELVEPFGIDESWLDVTASRRIFGTGEEIAEKIRRRVKEEIGITVSIGVSFNKVFAKFGSDYKKPDAITVITRDNFPQIIYPKPVSELLFVGKKTAQALNQYGIKTIGELAAASKELLIKRFGKYGETLHIYSNGLDDTPVCAGMDDDIKSISNGQTFRHDLMSYEECKIGIDFLSDEVARRLRKNKMKAATLSISVKDRALRVIQRQRGICPPTDISSVISKEAFEILKDEWIEGKPVRSITVSCSNLVKNEFSSEQIDIFGENDEKIRKKSKRKDETVDKIKEKYGENSILRGAVMSSDIGVERKKSKFPTKRDGEE